MFPIIPGSSAVFHAILKRPVLSVLIVGVVLLIAIPVHYYMLPITEKEDRVSFVEFTFDDGAESVYKYAYPILEKYEYTGTVFVTTEYIDEPFFMSMDQLDELYAQGWVIGSHGKNHLDLTTLNITDLKSEIADSKRYLNTYGFNVTLFAPPYGEYDDLTASIILEEYTSFRTATNVLDVHSELYEGEHWFLNDDQHQRKLLGNVILNYTTSTEVKSEILRAKNEGKTIYLVFHQFESQDSEYSYNITQFEDIVVFVKEIE